MKVHAGKMTQDAALKTLQPKKQGKKKALVLMDGKLPEGAEPDTASAEATEWPQDAESSRGQILPIPARNDAGLRQLLRAFLDGLEGFDLSSLETRLTQT